MLLKAMLNNPYSVAREMDRLFDSMFQPYGAVPTFRAQPTFPPVNVWEEKEGFYAEAELPGMTMDDVEVLVTEDVLTIKGTRNVDVPAELRPLRRERSVGAFERAIGLPVPIEPDRVEAKLVNGVLSISLPKAPEAKPRRVQVKALTDAS
jgi:HSP20 family protein